MRALVRNGVHRACAFCTPDFCCELSFSLVGRTSWSAADVLVGPLDSIANRATLTGTSGAAQESRPTLRRRR